MSACDLREKPPHPARPSLAALSCEGKGQAVLVATHGLSSAWRSPLPSRERADAAKRWPGEGAFSQRISFSASGETRHPTPKESPA